MIAGHTRCLVDGCFGLLKLSFQRSDNFTIEQLAEVVNTSAACNIAQLYPGSTIAWRMWDVFFGGHFKPLPGVSKAHYFTFEACRPGQVLIKQALSGKEVSATLLKTTKKAVLEAGLPPRVPVGGLSRDCQTYLLKEL